MKYKIFTFLTFVIILASTILAAISIDQPIDNTVYWKTDDMSEAKLNLVTYTLGSDDIVTLKLIVPGVDNTSSIIKAPSGYYFTDDTKDINIFDLLNNDNFTFIEKKDDVSVYYLENESNIIINSNEGIAHHLSTSDYQLDLSNWSYLTEIECNMFYSEINEIREVDYVVEDVWTNIANNELLSVVVILTSVIGVLTFVMIVNKKYFLMEKNK